MYKKKDLCAIKKLLFLKKKNICVQLNEGVNALSQYFESASLHEFEVAYDCHNTTDMKVCVCVAV